jgi:hypothetical protein
VGFTSGFLNRMEMPRFMNGFVKSITFSLRGHCLNSLHSVLQQVGLTGGGANRKGLILLSAPSLLVFGVFSFPAAGSEFRC